jgi:hypothetical protein
VRSVIIFIFLLIPLVDALNGYLLMTGGILQAGVFSPSQIARSIILMLLLGLYFRKNSSLGILLVIVWLLLVEVISAISHQNLYGLSYGVITVSKISFLIMLIYTLKTYCSDMKSMKELITFFKYTISIVSFFICFSAITGLGKSTYGQGFATKSYFASGNGLGVFLGAGISFLLGMKKEGLLRVSNVFLLFLIFSLLLVGTKTAFILASINMLILLYVSKHKVLIVPLLIVCFVYFFDYIVASLNVMFDVILMRLSLSDDFVSYVGSGRIGYILNSFVVYFDNDPGVLRMLFGMGAFVSFRDPESLILFDTLESDFFDLFFMYGALSSFVMLVMITVTLSQLKGNYILFLGFLMFSLHSLLFGHVLFNGMVSTCFALYIHTSKFLFIQRKVNA